jgi:hypothetical protein
MVCGRMKNAGHVIPAKEAVRKLVQIPSCRSGTARRAGPGTYEHPLCQCVGRPAFMVSGLAGWRPRPGMTSFLDFLTPSIAGIHRCCKSRPTPRSKVRGLRAHGMTIMPVRARSLITASETGTHGLHTVALGRLPGRPVLVGCSGDRGGDGSRGHAIHPTSFCVFGRQDQFAAEDQRGGRVPPPPLSNLR